MIINSTINKTDRVVNSTIDRKYGVDGKSIEADIDIANQRVGFKQEGEANFTYIDLPKLEFDDLTQAQKDSLKVSDVTKENIYNALGFSLDNILINKIGKVDKPADFDFKYNFDILRSLNTTKLTGINKNTFRKSLIDPVNKYVDYINGNDSNTGNDWNNAYKTLGKLYNSTYDRAYFKSGNYSTLTNVINNSDAEFISIGGNSNFFYGVLGSERTWTNQGGGVYSNVMTASPYLICETNVYDEDGLYFRYSEVFTLSDCQTTPSTYYRDSSTNTTYIHTSDNNTPNRNDLILSLNELEIKGGKFNYCENITFIGGVSVISDLETFISHLNCKSIFSKTINGYTFKGNITSYLENCIASKNFLDGFNYHGFNGFNCTSIEVDCIAFKNGEGNTSSINNGSTTHEDGRILRVGGCYFNNEGPNVHDVNSSKSFNIDAVSYDSIAINPENRTSFALGAGNNETGKMWLDGCLHKGVEKSLEDRAGLNNIYIRNSVLPNIEVGTNITFY
jgi:hypothetical protein